jgi:uncharacterized membrane protein
MAGIGFALRRLLERESYSGLARAYAYASVIGSGPWLLSIVGILVIGVMSTPVVYPPQLVAQFQTSVTYLIAFSLILTGPLQLGFTRYVADLFFAGDEARIVPNFIGVLSVVTFASGALALAIALAWFRDLPAAYVALMVCGFVVLSNLWVATILLSGLKEYHSIAALYALGYGVSVVAALVLRPYGLEGLLAGFVAGQALLLGGMVLFVLRSYRAQEFLRYDFLGRGAMFPALLATGLAFNLAVWTDKLLFWFSPATGEDVIGPLRASVIYDLPIFLAYLSIVPGMAVFLVRMETDFAEAYQRFYGAVRDGGRLDELEQARNEMVASVRRGLFEIIKIQSIAALIVVAAGPWLLEQAGIPQLYLPLLYVDVVGAGLQVVLLGILNVFFYLDKRRAALHLTTALLILNAAFTWLTLHLEPAFFGYGFAAAMLVSVLAGFLALDRKLDRLEYETFMLQ